MYWAGAQSATIRRAWMDRTPKRLQDFAAEQRGGRSGRRQATSSTAKPTASTARPRRIECRTADNAGDYSSSLALDTTAGKLYWTNVGGGGTIRRSNLDGTNVEMVAIGNIGFPSILVVDPAGSQMF